MSERLHHDTQWVDMMPLGALLSDALPNVFLQSAIDSDDAAAMQREAAGCTRCGGAGYVTQPVPFGHPNFGVLFPCVCRQAAWAERRREELLRLSNLDVFRDMTFATFDPNVAGLRRAFLQAREYAERMTGWLSLLGGYGVGKTHLAAAIANAALAHNIGVIFAVVPDLLDHLRATFAPSNAVSYDARFELIRNAPLLILDDLGTESATPWAREKLYQIVNHRSNVRAATVFTSNVAPEQLDGRIFSRMCDPRLPGQIIHIDAADYRRREHDGALCHSHS
jgi:DNA replication protein DnaC